MKIRIKLTLAVVLAGLLAAGCSRDRCMEDCEASFAKGNPHATAAQIEAECVHICLHEGQAQPPGPVASLDVCGSGS